MFRSREFRTILTIQVRASVLVMGDYDAGKDGGRRSCRNREAGAGV